MAEAVAKHSDIKSIISSKTAMLVKKVQDRKTAEIFELNQQNDVITFDEVQDILELSEEQVKSETTNDHVVVSILATMKSLAHTTQSRTRWNQFTKDRDMSNEVYTFSSKGDFTKYTQIVDSLTNPNPPRHIVMCTHPSRINDILKIGLSFEKKNEELRRPRMFRYYLDENDKYIDALRAEITTLTLYKSTQITVIVTATPEKIWSLGTSNHASDDNLWSNIAILNPKILDTDNSYLMFNDCIHRNTDDLRSPVESSINFEDTTKEDLNLLKHHEKVVCSYPNILTPGNVIFAPGMMRRRSHELVSKFWNNTYSNCAVFIFNGERTKDGFYGKLTLPNKSIIDIPHLKRNQFTTKEMIEHFKKNKENTDLDAQLNEVISEFYIRYDLSQCTVLFTGLLCIERAQTLVHPVWGTFTHCIYYKANNPDDKYQQQRQLGHIKNWSTFRGIPIVFSPDEFRKDVLVLEQRADNFSKMYGGTKATVSDYKSVSNGEITSHEKKEQKREERTNIRSRIVVMDSPEQAFQTLHAVNEFLTKNIGKPIKARAFHTTPEGYEISTRLKNFTKKNKEELVSDDRLTYEKFKTINKTQNISSSKGQPYMIYPVYQTMMSAPDEVKYYVSYLPPN